MNKKIKLTLMPVILVIVAQLSFAQTITPNFNQKAPASGAFPGKVIRSCFGGNTSGAKIIAVVNRADWCIICQKNTERVAAILPMYKSRPIAFVPNDITDEHSKTVSAKYLKKIKVYDAVSRVKQSGIIILIDAQSHQVVEEISLASSDQDIEAAINKSLTNRE